MGATFRYAKARLAHVLQPEEEPGSRDDESEMRFEDESEGWGRKGCLRCQSIHLLWNHLNAILDLDPFIFHRQGKWKRHAPRKMAPGNKNSIEKSREQFSRVSRWRKCLTNCAIWCWRDQDRTLPDLPIDGQIATHWSDGPETNQTGQFSRWSARQ